MLFTETDSFDRRLRELLLKILEFSEGDSPQENPRQVHCQPLVPGAELAARKPVIGRRM